MADSMEPIAKESLPARFRRMIGGVQDGIAIIEGGKVLCANDRLGEIMGYSPAELVHMTDLALAAPEELPRLKRSIQEAVEQGVPLTEFKFQALRKDGSRRYVRSRYCRWPEQDGLSRFLVLTSELAEQTRDADLARRERDEQELFLRAILDASPNLVFVKDRAARFVLVNQPYAQAYQLEPEDFVGKDELGIGWPKELVIGYPEMDSLGSRANDRAAMESGQVVHTADEWMWIGGERRQMAITRVPLRNAEGEVWGLVGYASTAVRSEPLEPEMGTLNNVCAALAVAADPEQVLSAAASPAMSSGAHVGALMYVDVDAGGQPEWADTVAAFGGPIAPLAKRFYLPDSPQAGLFCADPDAPLMVSDLGESGGGMPQDVIRIMQSVKAQAFMSLPLVAGGRWHGLVTIAWPEAHEFSPEEQELYRQILTRLSATVQGQRLREDAQRRAVWSQTAAEVSRAAATILERNQMMERVVNLVHERFDLYYVGLFLLSPDEKGKGEPGQFAFLQVGSGEAGQQMVAQGHRLEIGGASMIGQCLATKQPRVAMDVGREAVHFANPLLPDTRTELALPLVSRGQALGALSIQSVEAAAFSAEDIAVLQTMADQLATAIDNAEMFERAQARADRERRVRDITERIHRSPDAGILMRVAVEELSQMLGASKAVIRLGTRERLIAESGGPSYAEE